MQYLVFVLCVALIVAVWVIIRLEARLYDERWTREKIWPLILEVECIPEGEREYLAPAIMDTFLNSDLTIDEAIELAQNQKHPV